MNYKIAQLILSPGRKVNSTCEVYISQPDSSRETLAGKLFALIEIESRKAEDLKIINFIITNLNYNYYQNEKMILRERLSNLKVEHIFESALAKTNKKLAEFLQTERINLNSNLINITVGVIDKDCLHFSCLGKNKALLIYKNITVNKEQKYKLADISEQAKSEVKKQINLIKLFSNVVSGSIPPGGYFIFTNEALVEYLSNKQLINIVTTLPPASAVEQIKNILIKINDYVPFLCIIIKNTLGQDEVELKKEITAASTQTSLNNLNVTEETTEKLLTPSGLINFKKWSTTLIKLFEWVNLTSLKKTNNHDIFLKRKPTWLSLDRIFKLLKNTFIYITNILIFFYKTLTNRKKIIEVYHNSRNKTSQFKKSLKIYSSKTIFWYNNLTSKNKILLTSFLLILLIFTGNLLLLNFNNKASQKQELYDDLIKTIEQKQNQIDASLLYSNEVGAKKVLDEVKPLLNQFPNKTNEQKSIYEKLIAKNLQQIEKINHIIDVESPTELANFINLNSQVKPTNIIEAKGKIYAADAAQKSIYSLEIEKKLITAITDIVLPLTKLDYPTKDDKNNIYYLNTNSIIMLNTQTEEISSLNINYKNSLNQIAATSEFNNKLYLLDTKNNQIYRYNKTNEGFMNSANWITERVDLTNFISFDIDGNIYLLKNDGQVFKFLKGKKQNFNLDTIDPIITKPTKIIVSLEQKYIYLLEPVNKRLVIFDKSGKFLNQYVVNQLTDLKDFIVDEIAKKIYFLNNTSIYVVEAKHFVE